MAGARATRVTGCILLLWAGLVVGVSFLATPAKFLAPSLSLQVALDVGRQAFFVLNRLELALAAVVAVLGMRSSAPKWRRLALFLPGLMVLAQTGLLLPLLDLRVEQFLSGAVLPHSPLHLIYVACELAKVAWLFTLGLWFR
ncbi:hypothetical protein SAMN05519103_08762 [Rhizobiales bacterium GAS113]|nr:hypothetical protein SAMN05519103_08762 [Rhizobiales bacterium GAS113]